MSGYFQRQAEMAEDEYNENEALRERIDELKNHIVELLDFKADAERYRWLEHQCRTGTYRGIISRADIDESMKQEKGDGVCW